MTTNPLVRIKATKREKQLYADWQAAEQRVRMALQTLNGAQAAVLNAEVAFKVAARVKHGDAATFEAKDGNLVFVVPKA